MTLFCFLASLTSLSWAIWVTKCFFLSDSNHNAWSWNPKLGFENTIGWCVFVAASAKVRFPVECIAACLHGWPRPDTQTPLRISRSALWDLCCWCVLAFYPKCLPTKQTSACARSQTTDLLSPSCVCPCPATPRYRTLWHAEKFPLSFSDTVVFLWNHAPNTRSVGNPPQESPSFYPTFLQTPSLV